MEKLSMVRDGGRNLPPGFRFEPTDEEIVFQYLSRKTFSHPLPSLLIPEFDVFAFDPSHLPGRGDGEQDMYFFCNKEDGGERGRACDSGFWKPIGPPKRIACSKQTAIVGIRKSFVFYRGSSRGKAVTTDWMMHEYYITFSDKQNSQDCLIRIGKWTMCHVRFMKKRMRVEVDCDTSDSYSSSASSSDSNFFEEVSS